MLLSMSPAMLARPQEPSKTNLLPRGVRRALDAMRANVGRDWTVIDLAGAAGVSGRTLQRQFKMFLGKTPHAALRDIRSILDVDSIQTCNFYSGMS